MTPQSNGRPHIMSSFAHGYRCRGCPLVTKDLTTVARHVVAAQFTVKEEPVK